MRGHENTVLARLDIDARLTQRGNGSVHLLDAGAFQLHLAAGDRRGAGIGAGFDTVGHHLIGRAMQTLDPVDGEVRRADAFDLRAHGHQQVAQVDNFRLTRGIVQTAHALGQRGSHQRVLRRAHRDHGEGITPARQATIGRNRADIASSQLDPRAKSFQHLQVQIDRTVANGATAGQRHRSLARAGQQRAQHQNRGAHLAHQFIRRGGAGQARGGQRDNAAEILRTAAGNGGGNAELVQQVLKPVHIRQTRQITQGQRFLRQQGAR